MAETTFSWRVANLDRNLADGMVTTVHYTVDAVSDDQNADGEPYRAGAYGSIGLKPANKKSMISYTDLDEATVASWVQAEFGAEKVQTIQEALKSQIELQRTPVTGSGVPWNS
jgi:hypothetical protein